MKLAADYLERSVHVERMAAEADNPNLKEQLLEQAAAYRWQKKGLHHSAKRYRRSQIDFGPAASTVTCKCRSSVRSTFLLSDASMCA